METRRLLNSSRPSRRTTFIPAILDQPRACPKCRQTLPLTTFKRRSRAQDCAPSWCRVCRNAQDRARRARQRELEAHEYLRRIRFGTSPTKVETLFALAAYRAGSIEALGDWFAARLRSGSNRSRLAASILFMKLTLARAWLEKTPRSQPIL